MAAIPVEGKTTTTTKIYTVVKGDTLSGIAVKVTKLYKQTITWQSIASWNSIKSPYTIKVGQKLKIVVKQTTTTAPSTGGGSTTTAPANTGSATPSALPTTILDKVIGGVILYGIYKTFQKIF